MGKPWENDDFIRILMVMLMFGDLDLEKNMGLRREMQGTTWEHKGHGLRMRCWWNPLMDYDRDSET